MPRPRPAPGHGAIADDIAAFIKSDGFPCVGAKSALRLGQITAMEAGNFRSSAADTEIHSALSLFGRELAGADIPMRSFICGFHRTEIMTEEAFEAQLWRYLQALHDIDIRRRVGWAPGISQDPTSTEFNMSVDGRAYFVIGLHRGASRAARRFCRPALIFNSHDQFETLRADGRYDSLQAEIRGREVEHNGGVNPMLGDHGRRAQAPQFSGRNVSVDWRCPFIQRTPS